MGFRLGRSVFQAAELNHLCLLYHCCVLTARHLKCYWALTNEDEALDVHLPRQEWRKVKLCVYTCAYLMVSK